MAILSNRSWCSSGGSRIDIMLIAVSPTTARRVAPENVPTKEKITRVSSFKQLVRASLTSARRCPPQRSSPGLDKNTGPTSHRYEGLPRTTCPSGTPRQTRTSGLVPNRGAPFAGNGRTAELCPTAAAPFAGNGLSRHQLCPKGLSSDHSFFSNTTLHKKDKIASMSMNQCVHHDHCARHQDVRLLTLLASPFILNSTKTVRHWNWLLIIFWKNTFLKKHGNRRRFHRKNESNNDTPLKIVEDFVCATTNLGNIRRFSIYALLFFFLIHFSFFLLSCFFLFFPI